MAFAGFVASAFELATARRASFRLLGTGDLQALASVPVIVATAPFIILRAMLGDEQTVRRPPFIVLLATVIACGWGMLSGRLVLDIAVWTMTG